MQRPPRYPRRDRAVVVVVAVAVVAVLAAVGVAVGWTYFGAGHDDTGGSAPATESSSGTGPSPGATPSSSRPDSSPGADDSPDAQPPTTPAPPGPSTTTTLPGPTTTATGIDLAAHSTTDPASIWVVVNKQHPVDPLDYEPTDLVTVDDARVRQVVQADLEAMLAAAEADGVRMGLRTGFRSYGSQAAIRADVEARRGYAHAEKYSARPGYSEHQTGLAFDVHGTSQPACDLQTCFADTAEGRWVAAHAAEYGFLVRYTPENTGVTGFAAEAWHLRYVGRELSAWMRDNGVGSLEEALGVSGGPDYPTG